jgi:hypothetical protein
MAELIQIHALLVFCGFSAASSILIADDGFTSFDDIASLDIKNIKTLAEGFAARTTANGKMVFGMRRTINLERLVHWAQDFKRISRTAVTDGIADMADQATFLAALEVAGERAKMRKHKLDESDNLSKAADPGKLKKQKDWLNWERALQNFLSTIPGQDGVPLSYLIRADDAPSYVNEGDDDFEQLCIEAAPLTGTVFQADSRKVHQFINGFVQSEFAETWVKPNYKRKNGRIDYKALSSHFGGEGNKLIRIKEAEALRKTLVYRNERAMTFEKFLTSMNLMFVAYQENGEPIGKDQQIRLLFEKINHPNLETIKSSLMVAESLDKVGDVDYEFIVNSISAEVANLSDYVSNRQASGVGTHADGMKAPASGVIGSDGKVFTGYYGNWKSLSQADKDSIFDERKRLNIKPKSSRRASAVKGSSTHSLTVKEKKRELSTLTRKIASLKKKVAFKLGAEAVSEDDSVQHNAGDSFGGRAAKKAKKD